MDGDHQIISTPKFVIIRLPRPDQVIQLLCDGQRAVQESPQVDNSDGSWLMNGYRIDNGAYSISYSNYLPSTFQTPCLRCFG